MKILRLESRRRTNDPDYVHNGDYILHATRSDKGRVILTLELGSGDYLDGMTGISIELTPTQRKQLKAML